MTNKEAIEIIEHTISCVTGSYACCDHDCRFCAYRQDKDSVVAALSIAIEALDSKSEAEEYRTPKKVIKGIGFHRMCPACESDAYSADGNYCSICGQALDWSEEDE